MHDFLRAVGFKNIKDQKRVRRTSPEHRILSDKLYVSERFGRKRVRRIHKKEFADSMGIIVRGEFTDHDNFRIEYYIPYFYGHGITSQEQTEVQKHAEKRILCRNL